MCARLGIEIVKVKYHYEYMHAVTNRNWSLRTTVPLYTIEWETNIDQQCKCGTFWRETYQHKLSQRLSRG